MGTLENIRKKIKEYNENRERRQAEFERRKQEKVDALLEKERQGYEKDRNYYGKLKKIEEIKKRRTALRPRSEYPSFLGGVKSSQPKKYSSPFGGYGLIGAVNMRSNVTRSKPRTKSRRRITRNNDYYNVI